MTPLKFLAWAAVIAVVVVVGTMIIGGFSVGSVYVWGNPDRTPLAPQVATTPPPAPAPTTDTAAVQPPMAPVPPAPIPTAPVPPAPVPDVQDTAVETSPPPAPEPAETDVATDMPPADSNPPAAQTQVLSSNARWVQFKEACGTINPALWPQPSDMFPPKKVSDQDFQLALKKACPVTDDSITPVQTAADFIPSTDEWTVEDEAELEALLSRHAGSL